MREILFKAKRIDNGEWVEGSLVKSVKQYFIFTGEGKLISNIVDWIFLI